MKNKSKIICIIQARMGATRLPGKVLKKVKGITLLEYEINRVKKSKGIDKIVVATSDKKNDDKIEKLCKQIKVDCFRGSETDVLDRYYQCALRYPAYENIVRITGDCPLIDPIVIDEVIAYFQKYNFDYVSNNFDVPGDTAKETFPDGMDIEIFKRSVLYESAKKAKLPSEREHVTLHITKSKKYKKGNFLAPHNWSHFRLTVDTPADFAVIKFLIEKGGSEAGYLDYISLLTKNPEIMLKNMNIVRNEGLIKSLREDASAGSVQVKKVL
jgi:spore coat polysaccharide biosynthesis protein SpsF